MQHRTTGPHRHFLKSLGLTDMEVHPPFNHFDFRIPGRRILVIGPMGSGKTEFSARVWRDSQVVKNKGKAVSQLTSEGQADRRNVFFIRSVLDGARFPDYPEDALAFRGGFERMGGQIARIHGSYDFESLLAQHPEVGTWIIDEASFYDERLIYVMKEASEKRGLSFIFPTLILNFRKDIFNSSARLLLENSTDLFALTAYCEHPECVEDSFFTYRYYLHEGRECPALYFDPLIIVGGDRKKEDPKEPNYGTRCDSHHYLPGKEYTFLTLKPLAERYIRGEVEGLSGELEKLHRERRQSLLWESFRQRRFSGAEEQTMWKNALTVPLIAEKALIFLFAEMNLLREEHLMELTDKLSLDDEYISKRLRDNGRPVDWGRTRVGERA